MIYFLNKTSVLVNQTLLSLALSSGTNREDPASFLFSLVNPSGLNRTKMSMIPGNECSAIYCSSSVGPVFGRGRDLCITNSPNTNSCTSNLNNTYQLPAGQNAKTFLTGKESFTVNEMEVFRFEK